MQDLPKTMSLEEWCDFSYHAVHLGDPRARLTLARLYKEATHVADNMRYALFWLGMASESYKRKSATDAFLRREIIEEMSKIEEQLSDEEWDYILYLTKCASILPFGISGESVPSDEEVESFRKLVSQ